MNKLMHSCGAYIEGAQFYRSYSELLMAGIHQLLNLY